MAMQMEPVTSSMIAAVGYDDEKQQLTVQFNNGRTYNYGGVPQSEYNNLVTAPSVGSYFAQNIKNIYRVE